MMLIPPVSDIAELVLSAFRRREVLPRLSEVVDRVGLFHGLEEEQLTRLAAACRHRTFPEGAEIFRQGEPCEERYLLLEGEVGVHLEGRASPIGRVRAGECLGEISVLTGGAHAATARTLTAVEAGVLTKQDLESLVRLRPGIGVVLYRNLARGLGEKLRRTDLDILSE
jgi:CRP-like cAMP-binding protein